MALTTTLESLPFDTIVVIARHLPEARDLANLAAVSRGLWAACEELAQREVRLLLGRAAVSLAVGGQVASWVHELAFFRACLAGRTVAAGSYTSLVLDTRQQQQQLFTCGSGKLGQLGRGEAEDMDQCGAVDMAGAGASAPIVKIDAGCAHTAVLLGDGRVATFGDARYHQLGHGENRIQPVPRLLGGALAGEHVVDVACGSSHTVFVTRSGSVYGCGTGFNGQLGFGRETEGSRLPMLMRGLEGVHVVRAACGLIHTVLLTSQGSVYTCGSNGHGQLGLGLDLSIEVLQPRLVASLAAAQPMVQVACGSLMTMLLTARGRVFVCGGGEPGVLGLPGITEAREPLELRVPSGLRVVHMAAGHDLTVLVDEQGNAFYCGGFRGRRIDGSRPAVTVAHSPTALASRAQLGRVTQAAAGNAHALLRTTRGLYAFGGNARGQLGRPADRTLFLPDPVPLPLSPVS